MNKEMLTRNKDNDNASKLSDMSIGGHFSKTCPIRQHLSLVISSFQQKTLFSRHDIAGKKSANGVEQHSLTIYCVGT